jgi:hypothetical protein
MNEIILAPCNAGYVQSCTGFHKQITTKDLRTQVLCSDFFIRRFIYINSALLNKLHIIIYI